MPRVAYMRADLRQTPLSTCTLMPDACLLPPHLSRCPRVFPSNALLPFIGRARLMSTGQSSSYTWPLPGLERGTPSEEGECAAGCLQGTAGVENVKNGRVLELGSQVRCGSCDPSGLFAQDEHQDYVRKCSSLDVSWYNLTRFPLAFRHCRRLRHVSWLSSRLLHAHGSLFKRR